MNFKDLPVEQKKELTELLFKKLESAQELKEWVMAFLGLDLPIHSVDADSNSSPIDAMWEIYNTIKNNGGDVTPGFIMLSARECYKCQVKGSKLLTKNGLKNIEDAKIGDIVWTGFSWQKITNHIYDGFKAGITVEVDGGLKFTGSPIHRYWALRDGQEQWIRSDELNPETDLICINTDTGLKGQQEIDPTEYEHGYFLGLLAGDGSVSAINSLTHKHFGFTTIDETLKTFFYNYVNKYFNCKIFLGTDKITHSVWDKKAIDVLKSMGVKADRSWEKTIPSYAYSSVSAMKGFVSGLLDTDGSFGERGSIILSITSLALLEETQKALLSFGVLSRIRTNKKMYGNQKHIVSTLIISHSEIKKLLPTGISMTAKKANVAGGGLIPNTHDTLPANQIKWFLDSIAKYGHIRTKGRIHEKPKSMGYDSVSVEKLARACDWMEESGNNGSIDQEDIAKTAKMRSILKNKWRKFSLREEDSVEFYDLTVENDHSYWSNGSISHNTLGASILEVLLMIHYELTIAHISAILSQSAKAIQYINYFFGKLQPLLDVRGWTNTSQNKGKIEFRTPEGEDVYIRVIVCTLGGANSEHTNILVCDEIDVIRDPRALEEAKMIPGYSKGVYPLTVKLSTRKFNFGNMQKELDRAAPGPNCSGDIIVRWNILDVTEKCPPKRHKPELPREDVYVAKNLPLRQVSVKEYSAMSDVEKLKWSLLSQVHGGCVDCKLLPVCKTKLSERGQEAVGGLYKPITSVINSFKKIDPDMAEAQLMCWRPSSKGLVYPRFDSTENSISLEKAFHTLLGDDAKEVARDIGYTIPPRPTSGDLIGLMHKLHIDFFAGVDWGYTHDFVIVIFARLPNGDIWVMDCYSEAGLEFSDCLETAKVYRDIYHPTKWFCDTSMPSHIKSFTKNGMRSPSFTKDVMGGIEALRSKIVDGSGRRFLKVLLRPETMNIVAAFQKHHFKLGSDGNPTLVPDDTPGTADQADAMRYVAQNLFPVRGTQKINSTYAGGPQEQVNKFQTHTEQMMQEIAKRVEGSGAITKGGSGRKGGFHFSF